MVKHQSRLHLWLALLYFLALDHHSRQYVECKQLDRVSIATITHDLQEQSQIDERLQQDETHHMIHNNGGIQESKQSTTKQSMNIKHDYKKMADDLVPGLHFNFKKAEATMLNEGGTSHLSGNWKEIRNLRVTNIEDLGNGTRDDIKSLQHSCDKIRKVPIIMRLSFEIDFKFKKYTEAYGIPIVSTYDVDDRALKRACYLVRFMLADIKDARDNFYDRRGWVNVLGMNENANRLSKYCPLPHWRDGIHFSRAISPTWTYPVTTLAEENLLCVKKNDAMRNEDFGIHALAHAIHVVALRFVDPEFNIKLTILHRQAKKRGLWNNTYAIRNALEYWAEGVQSYFSVNVERGFTDSVHNGINTRQELKDYDRDLYDLIYSIFPCQNSLISRCHDFWQEKSMEQELRVNYPSCISESKAKEIKAAPQKQSKRSTVKDVIYIFVFVGISVVLYFVTKALINKNWTEST